MSLKKTPEKQTVVYVVKILYMCNIGGCFIAVRDNKTVQPDNKNCIPPPPLVVSSVAR